MVFINVYIKFRTRIRIRNLEFMIRIQQKLSDPIRAGSTTIVFTYFKKLCSTNYSHSDQFRSDIICFKTTLGVEILQRFCKRHFLKSAYIQLFSGWLSYYSEITDETEMLFSYSKSESIFAIHEMSCCESVKWRFTHITVIFATILANMKLCIFVTGSGSWQWQNC
jgi:hypothetical protein